MFKMGFKSKSWEYSQAERPEKRDRRNAKVGSKCQESFSYTNQTIILNKIPLEL